MDRLTGEVLSATPYVHITTTKGVDLKTGRLQVIAEKATGTGRMVRDICPFSAGAKDWQPTAFSPKTGLLYIPHNNMCEDMEGTEVSYIAGTPYVGAHVRMYAGPGGHRGEYTAWDPVAAKPVFKIKERFPVWSGTVATAGDVTFYGTMDGWFKADPCADRPGALATQSRLGNRRAADHIQRTGRQAICSDSGRSRRVGRRDCRGRFRPARCDSRA